MRTAAVKIGPSFFAKEFQEYSNWRWSYIREAAQNCIDAPHSTEMYFSITHDGPNTRVTFGNNGEPMDEDELTNKLLALGESGKNFAGTVGGFGKAKLLLLFCHLSWSVRTGTLLAEGEGGSYSLQDDQVNLLGTQTTVTIKGDLVDALRANVKLFALTCQWAGTILLDGHKLEDRTKKGTRRKDLAWGIIYTNKSLPGRLLVRMSGIPMFLKPISYKGCVLIELAGTSAEVLTSNRDGLHYGPQDELDTFLVDISTNARKALKDQKPIEKRSYAGYKLGGRLLTEPAAAAAKQRLAAAILAPGGCREVNQVKRGEHITVGSEPDTPLTQEMALIAGIVANTQPAAGSKTTAEAPTLTIAQVQQLLRPEFHVRSEIEGKVPAWYFPGTFSENSKRLVSNWIAVLVEMAVLTGSQHPFSVGFVFDPEVEGLHEREQGHSVLYVAPALIVKQQGKARQLKTRWKFDSVGNWRLLALAAHEWTHFEGFASHDENFSNRLTDLFA